MAISGYICLGIAIVSEVVGTAALKASEGFSKPLPAFIVVVSYATTFYYLSLVLKTIPVGIAYAIWSGLGIVLITVLSAISFKQIPDGPAVLGMLFIISGVVIINVWSMPGSASL